MHMFSYIIVYTLTVYIEIVFIHTVCELNLYKRTYAYMYITGWQRLIGSPKLQIIFHKRATKYRSLLQKMTYKDKGSYETSPPCNKCRCMHLNTFVYVYIFIYLCIYTQCVAECNMYIYICICVYVHVHLHIYS